MAEQLALFLNTIDVNRHCEIISEKNNIDIKVVRMYFYQEFTKMVLEDKSLLDVVLSFENLVSTATENENEKEVGYSRA